jgi:hypothetical protein
MACVVAVVRSEGAIRVDEFLEKYDYAVGVVDCCWFTPDSKMR